MAMKTDLNGGLGGGGGGRRGGGERGRGGGGRGTGGGGCWRRAIRRERNELFRIREGKESRNNNDCWSHCFCFHLCVTFSFSVIVSSQAYYSRVNWERRLGT